MICVPLGIRFAQALALEPWPLRHAERWSLWDPRMPWRPHKREPPAPMIAEERLPSAGRRGQYRRHVGSRIYIEGIQEAR